MAAIGGQMKVSELNKTIEYMRGVHPFKDDEAHIMFSKDLRSGQDGNIEVMFKEDGVTIALSCDVLRDKSNESIH